MSCFGKARQAVSFGANTFVPAFQENKLLDPKRYIYFYLKKTERFRKDAEGHDQTKLFLALNEPHNPVTSQTISKWIVQTVKLAYEDKNFKVKAHSTRAIGPTWALYNGASLKSILEAADWSSENCFMKFYLRDLDTKVFK